MKLPFKKITSIVLTIVMVLSLVSAIPFATVSAYEAGGISGTTGRGQTESDPVVVNTFAELDAALRTSDIKYVKAVSPNVLTAIPVSSDTGYRNALAISGNKHLTVEGTWDFTSNSTCDHLISVSGATLELAGSGTIRYSHNKMGGSGAVIKVHSSGTLKVLSDRITLEGYGNSDLYDAWGDPVYEKENQSRAIYVDGGKLEINGGTYKGSCYAFYPGDDYYVESVYITNNATATINGGTYSTQKYDSGILYKGGLRIVNSPDAIIKGGMFDGIRVESADGTDSIYNHLYRGTRMINLTKNNVFNTHTKQVLDDVEAINFIPYQFSSFTLNGKSSTGNGNFVAKINEAISFSFNVTPLSDELSTKGISSKKSFSIKDSSKGNVAVAGGEEIYADRYLSGSYTFKNAGKVTLNCYNNFYYNGEHLFSWATEAIYNVQPGSEILRVDMTVDRIKSNYVVPKPVPTTADNFIYAYYWYKLDANGSVNSGSLSSFGTLVKGEKYRLEVLIYPMAGFSFSNAMQFYINGQVAVVDNKSSSGVWTLHVDISVPNYRFEVFGAKAPIAGESAAHYVGYSSAERDFGGTTQYYWATKDSQPFYGTFEAGETYYYVWNIFKHNSGADMLPALNDIEIIINGGYADENLIFMDSSRSCLEVFKEYVCVSKGQFEEDVIKGDVNDDGYVDNLDAAMILKYDAGILDSINMAAADVNSDGYSDNLDAAMILKYDAGLINGF